MTLHIESVLGDITVQRVDAIVNAANSSLLGGGGVDGAIHRAAGPDLLAACREIRATTHPHGLPTGQAVATGAGSLPATWVVHTVGPQSWEHADGGADLLAQCHRNALACADVLGAQSVAFPAISCGAYGWSPVASAPIAIGAVRSYADDHPDSGITLVRFVLANDEALSAFSSAVSAVE